mgnify:CR=1 FL=1
MSQESFRARLVKEYYTLGNNDEEEVASQFVRDITIELFNSHKNYTHNLGYFFLAFEDLINKDPLEIFSQNMRELITCTMKSLCKKMSFE